MYGVVSLLDDQHNQRVESLWAQLDRRFGVRGINRTPYPHFSYHVASGYDEERLKRLMRAFARRTAAFFVRATGLGIFTGPEPVIYVPVVRDPALTALHQAFWPHVEENSHGSQSYYAPASWFPHITLGQGGINQENLADIVRWLNKQDLNWRIHIDNLALIGDDEPPHKLHFRLKLAA